MIKLPELLKRLERSPRYRFLVEMHREMMLDGLTFSAGILSLIKQKLREKVIARCYDPHG